MASQDDSLHRLASIARALGLGETAAEAEALAQRLAEGRFFVACMGQFKRGKSTLLNALVGEAVLPTGVVPVTSVVTVVRHGADRRARVNIDGAWREVAPADLHAYVAEAENPGNCKRVTGVEVFLPHALLATGLCLVDTPGLGSIFTAATSATHAFLPHVDAALIVLGADPPISADELHLVEQAAQHVGDILVVLNKADRLSDADRAEARTFTERVLVQRLGRPVDRLFDVSATERLATGAPTRDWHSLCVSLETLAVRSGRTLVRAAAVRGLRLLATGLQRELTERHEALRRPLAASAARVQNLRRCVADAEQALRDLHHQLVGEQERMASALHRDLEAFLEAAIPEARSALLRELDDVRALRGGALYEEAARIAQDIARALVERWRRDEAPMAEARYREATARFVEAANAFLAAVTSAGALDPAHAPRVLDEEAGFRVRGDFRHTELLPLTTPSPLAHVATLFLTHRRIFRVVQSRAAAYLERLVFTNGHRIANGLIEQASASRIRLEADLRRQLGELVRCAERALDSARTLQARGEAATHAEIARLDAIDREVRALLPADAA